MDPPSYPIFTILCGAWAALIWILDSLVWESPRNLKGSQFWRNHGLFHDKIVDT